METGATPVLQCDRNPPPVSIAWFRLRMGRIRGREENKNEDEPAYRAAIKSGRASESPPSALPSKLGRMMTLLVQVSSLIRKAAAPQSLAVRLVNEFCTHSVRGTGSQPLGVGVSACAMNTP